MKTVKQRHDTPQPLTTAQKEDLERLAAMQPSLDGHAEQVALLDRMKPIQNRAAKLGCVDTDFDMKAFSDELWKE